MALFLGAGFGNAFNEILNTKWGHLVNLTHLMGTVWLWLFGEPVSVGAGAVFFRVQPGGDIPIWTVWGALIGLCLICLYLLAKKIRGMEIVQ